MVSNNFETLNQYLGFDVQADSQVPKTHDKVVRKKSFGDWRHWFTAEDVDLFKPAYSSYMALTGYDCNDWTISRNPVIDPQYASIYMQSLPERVVRDTARRMKDKARGLFGRESG